MAELNPATAVEPTPTVDPALAANPVTTPETPAVPALSPKAQKLVDAGFANVKDDDEAFERVLSAYHNIKNDVSAQIQAALAEARQPQPTTPQVQEAQTGPAWKPPKIDKQEVARFRTADGWKPETPESIKQQYAAYQAHRDRFADSFLDDPEEALKEIVRKHAAEVVRQQQEQYIAQQTQQTFQQKVVAENPWLFENDPVTGKAKVGDFSALSAEGKLIDGYMAEELASGSTYERAWKNALNAHRLSKLEFQLNQATQAQTAQQTNNQQRQALLNRAAGAVNRSGSLPAPADPQRSQSNRRLTPGQRALQIAQRDGVGAN
jgi:hypothetical protein